MPYAGGRWGGGLCAGGRGIGCWGGDSPIAPSPPRHPSPISQVHTSVDEHKAALEAVNARVAEQLMQKFFEFRKDLELAAFHRQQVPRAPPPPRPCRGPVRLMWAAPFLGTAPLF